MITSPDLFVAIEIHRQERELESLPDQKLRECYYRITGQVGLPRTRAEIIDRIMAPRYREARRQIEGSL